MTIYAESIFLDSELDDTLQNRLKRQVVEGILSGRFRPGERMPSSRALARHLGVSRITVTLAYTDLVADDYLVARGRSGFFVSQDAPSARAFDPPETMTESRVDWGRVLTQRTLPGERIERPIDWRNYPYPFVYGQTDPTLFDHQNWRLCALQALGKRDFETLTSDQYERDDPKLVEYILRNILPRRRISARPENVLITLGAQNALWIAAQMLLTQRRVATIENPCYPGLRDILGQTRCRTHAVDVDDQGLPADTVPADTDVLFTTVSHQCPTNVTMPISRRKELLRRASDEGFIIVEDDYEFELSFQRSPSPSLKSLDEAGCVIYIGSFSKSLFPGLRLGYIVAPAAFVQEARALRTTVLRHPPGLIQRTAAYFLSVGHYDAQINRMRKAYQRRRQIMEQSFKDYGLTCAGDESSGGSSFWMQAPEHLDTEDLARTLLARGVVIEPGHAFFDPAHPRNNHYRLAYSSISSAKIGRGVELIAKAIAETGLAGAA
jgi:GntR family transcriptional regulator/MocR family aminotransferase